MIISIAGPIVILNARSGNEAIIPAFISGHASTKRIQKARRTGKIIRVFRWKLSP